MKTPVLEQMQAQKLEHYRTKQNADDLNSQHFEWDNIETVRKISNVFSTAL